MNYIVHRRFRGKAICGEVNLRYGTELRETEGMICTLDGRALAFPSSENAHLYFAQNDDGRGLERGALTYAIAYAPRGKGVRFTEEERNLICEKYKHWIRQDCSMLLFNHDFFNADVDELQNLADKLKIKIKE